MVFDVFLYVTPCRILNSYPHLGRIWLPLGIFIEEVNAVRLMIPK